MRVVTDKTVRKTIELSVVNHRVITKVDVIGTNTPKIQRKTFNG